MVGGRDGEPFLESIPGWTANNCALAITNDHSSFRVPVGGVSIKSNISKRYAKLINYPNTL